ncbi:MAG: EAL domain-containing protein [Cyanobacteria bacterium J06641_5]
MELALAGKPDVEAAAAEIYEQLQIPTVYLASYEDDPRLAQVRRERAYYGYVLRPYPDKTLQAAIEAALNVHYRQLRDRVNRESSYGQQLKLAEEALNYLIYHDRGTGLPNHLSLREQFSQALRRRHLETGGSEAASLPVGCLGLDNADDLTALPEISRHLRNSIGTENGLAYLGGERFAIVWPSLHREADVAAVANRLLAEMSACGYTCSLGIACNWQQALPIDRLLARARTALAAARGHGGNCHAFYHTQLETASYGPDSEQILLEKELNFALDRGELQLYYQPRIDLHNGQLTGVEALVRWFHPQLGNVPPSRFLPVAEDLGLMAPIGEWVCREASRQVRRWQEAYELPLVLAVNLDDAQFSSPNLDRTLANILTASDFDPNLLELEVTESLLVSDPQRAQQQLRALKGMGIKIAIDDFGTGYSSLSYLRQFPFDILKIDRCFVQNLHLDEKNGAIAVAIAQMAASLELRVVAEGVEAEAELTFLRQHPCNEAQGYFFSPPLPAERFALWLASKHGQNTSTNQ